MSHARHQLFAVGLVVGSLILPAGAAGQNRSQGSSAVFTTLVEPAFGISVNGLAADVNANPRCAALSLPCTHDEESDWGGYGLDASVGVNISRRLAVVGAFSTWAGRWDSVESIEAHRPEINRVRAWLGGFRLSPGFSRPNPRTLESNRPFVQILVGPERSTLFGVRPVAQLSAGLDMHGPFASRVRPGKPMTLRMDLGYRVALSGGERATGLHFFIGAVLGPRLGEG